MMNKVTILIPVYNEAATLDKILQKVKEANFCGLEKEIILIDDYVNRRHKRFIFKISL